MGIDHLRCEVLNASYEPLQPTPVRRALLLFIKGKAEITQEHPTEYVMSGEDVFPLPLQIRLFEMVKGRAASKLPAQLNNRNLFVRDGNRCQYCGRHKRELTGGEHLTRDHIFPQDKGGPNIWTNCVTACNKCNNKKANYTLSQCNMKLLKDPTSYKVPTIFEIMVKGRELRKKSD